MAHSQYAPRRKRSRMLYAIPLIALTIVMAAYALAVLPTPSPTAAMDFTMGVSIQVSNGTARSFIVPGLPVGVPGGNWASSRYNIYGLNGYYPIFTDPPKTNDTAFIVHVRSRVVRNYTLGDLFEVMGKTLGSDNTFNTPAQNDYVWEMCVGPPPRPGRWAAEVLVKDLFIVLVYHPSSSLGCL